MSIRYPKAAAETIDAARAPIELGQAEVLEWGHDGMFIACGTLVAHCVKAAATLRDEGLDVGVINARFVKPLDTETMLRAVGTSPLRRDGRRRAPCWAASAARVLEAATDAGLPCAHVRRLGMPDRFIEHAERSEQLADLGLDAAGITVACREMAAKFGVQATPRRRVGS